MFSLSPICALWSASVNAGHADLCVPLDWSSKRHEDRPRLSEEGSPGRAVERMVSIAPRLSGDNARGGTCCNALIQLRWLSLIFSALFSAFFSTSHPALILFPLWISAATRAIEAA